jgi:quinol monooxygenase YgiN
VLIVTAVFEVDPSRRDEFIASREANMRGFRGQDGCLEYLFAPDALVPGKVVLLEMWESREAFDAHQAAGPVAPPPANPVEVISRVAFLHDVASSQPL